MVSATHEHMCTLRRYISDNGFREALDPARPGIVDLRSWAYWKLKYGRYSAPTMPVRAFR